MAVARKVKVSKEHMAGAQWGAGVRRGFPEEVMF